MPAITGDAFHFLRPCVLKTLGASVSLLFPTAVIAKSARVLPTAEKVTAMKTNFSIGTIFVVMAAAGAFLSPGATLAGEGDLASCR